jgi:hypothetical protein
MADVLKGSFGAFNALKGSFRATQKSRERPSRRRDHPQNCGDRLAGSLLGVARGTLATFDDPRGTLATFGHHRPGALGG